MSEVIVVSQRWVDTTLSGNVSIVYIYILLRSSDYISAQSGRNYLVLSN